MSEKYQIFLSYSHADAEIYGIDYITEIKRQIEESIGENVFLDVDALKLGNAWNAEIQGHLDRSKVFICLLSENYIKSEYCTRERLWWAQKEMAKGRFQKATLPVFYIQIETEDETILQRWEEMQILQNDVRPWFPEGAGQVAAKMVSERLETAKLLARIDQISKDEDTCSKIICSVPSYNLNFVGRIKELSNVRQICHHSGMAASSIPVIHGEPGCGKSEIAFAYAHGYASEYPGGLFFVPMEHVTEWSMAWQKLSNEYDNKRCMAIYELLGLTKDDRKLPPEEFAEKFARQMWIHISNSGRTLILLDNLDCMELISEGGLKGLFPNGMIPENLDLIATTRNTPHLPPRSKAVSVPIGDLGEEAALELLRLHCEGSDFNQAPPMDGDETAAAKELLKFLQYHAWSVEIIAGYLGQEYRYGATPRKILEQLKDNFKINIKYKTLREIPDSIDALLNPTIEQIRKQELGGEILELASAAAMFSPDAVGPDLLRKFWIKRYGGVTCSKTDSWLWAWETLKDHHLLAVENNGISRMHRLTQKFFLKFGQEKQKGFADDIRSAIKQTDKSDLKKEDAVAVAGLAKFILAQSWNGEFLHSIPNWVHDILLEWYCIDDAKILLDELEKIANDHKDDADLAYSLSRVRGYLYERSGNFAQALEKYQNALKTAQDAKDDQKIATSYNDIGCVYSALGEHKKSLENHTKSLKIRQQTLPENHPDIAASYNNIGNVYSDLGDFEKSLEFYTKSLEIYQQTLPENQPSIASSYNNIGSVYSALGEHKKSLEFCTKSLEIRQQTLPENHPDIAASYNNIGLVYKRLKDYEKTLEFYTQSLKIQKQTLPENHSDIAVSYNNIGNVYSDLGDFENALENHTKSLEIRQQTLPENHPDIAASYYNIGCVYSDLGDFEKSLENHTKSLEIRQQTLSENQPSIAVSYNNIGSVYSALGDFEKALENHTKSLEIRQQTLPENHPGIADSYYNIGLVYKRLKDYENALLSFTKAKEIYAICYGVEHPETVDCNKRIEDIKGEIAAG